VPNPAARLRLVCFPYAGGGATLFRRWPERLGLEVELWAAQLPGREARRGEPPVPDLRALGRSLAGALAHSCDPPFAFFGHSMGAVLAFETARELRRLGARGPEGIVVSACGAPHLPNLKPPTYHLPEDEFRAELARLNGTPRELLDNSELMALMMPTLRADFTACQTYAYVAEPPLACPITAMGGKSDTEVAPENLERWRVHTTGAFSLRVIPGDHFFIHTAAEGFLGELTAELKRLVERGE
jgi:medium-chain acyl-[acyl-carrier-protein] hydrolase